MDNTFFIGVQTRMSNEMVQYVQDSLDEFLNQC